MFVYKSTNYETMEKDSITGNNVIEFCIKVLNYDNQQIIDQYDDNNLNYNVKFIDIEGNIICEISEDGLKYAIEGDIQTESEQMKEESQIFWEMNQSKVNSIEFNNPIHAGDGIWDVEYDEVSDDDEDEEDEDDNDNEYDYIFVEQNHNILS